MSLVSVHKSPYRFFLLTIVVLIDLQKYCAEPQSSSYEFNLLDSGPYDSHTSLCNRSACMVEYCANGNTLLYVRWILQNFQIVKL